MSMATDEIELFHFENIHQNRVISIDSFDNDDASSVVNTSHSDSTSNVFNSRTKEINSRPKCDPIEPSKTYIGSVSVKDSTNVFFGTIFKQPVVINNLITDTNDVKYNTNIQHNQKRNPFRNRAEQSSEESYRKRHRFFGNKRRIIILVLASAVVLVAAIIVVRYYVHLTIKDIENIDSPSSKILPEKDIDYGFNDGEYELIVRHKYGAKPPKTVIEPLKLPIRRVIVGHTATPNCTDYSDCVSNIRQMQNFHMNEREWDDIAYNFLVGGDGRAYEGRGYRVGAHTKSFNKDSLFIAFIGDFTSVEAPEKQLGAAQRLIIDGIKMSQIHPDYVLYGQRQIRGINSPGIKLYNQITLWSHWSKEIIPL